LLALGFRGFVVGYQCSNSDGVHGWLTPDETKRLIALVEPLKLPALKPTFRAMQRTRHWNGYGMKGWEFNELSLAFVRTVATIASVERKGILWGNDLLGFD
jgi:hypothetical protein